MGTMYEVISPYSVILSSITGYANLLSISNKYTKLDILEYDKTDLWAYFKFNDSDAYVLKSDLKLITGPITIKYIDKNSNKELVTSESFTNLSLGSYIYDAKTISGYSIYGDNKQTVTLTSDNTNIIITFSYSKILGTIYVKYLDDSSLAEIKTTDTFNNLEIKSYSYTAASIDNYNLSNESPQIITLTDSNPNQTVIFKYTKIYGSVTIKYINNNSNLEIFSSKIYNNLELGSYSYEAISIENYSLVNNSTAYVTLTKNNPNATIVFLYNLCIGTITIKYIDKPANIEIASAKIIENLVYGSYTYTAEEIDGYKVINDSSQTVTLNDSNKDITIIFEYDIVYLPLDEALINEVPYISTYYIKPIVKPNEEVKIDFYITDYYHKNYLEEDFSERFTVTAKVTGKSDIVIRNVKAGDNSIILGSFFDEGEKEFSILCTDKYGRNSHELFNFFLVRNDVVVNEYVMTTEDLIKYNIKNTDDY